MYLYDPDEIMKNLYNKITKECKIAFLSAMLWSFAAHMYIMTNNYPNHDGIKLIRGS